MELADAAGGFSPLASRNRWLALQNLRSAAGVDAVVLVLGPDARFSRGSEVAFNWLLGGLGGRDLLDAALEKKYEECVLCIRDDRSAIFCRRALQEEMVTKTAMWEGAEVIVPSKEEEKDVDLYDAFKVSVFMDMVKDCASIAVALRASELRRELKMALEDWPLVQAYGYDEYGQGFLTLKKQVTNIEALLQQQAYPCWDLQTVAKAAEQLPQLQKVWHEALLLQDKAAAEHLARPVALEAGGGDCPGKHGLHCFQAAEEGWRCVRCQKAVGKGSRLYGCRWCEYDVCTECYTSAMVEKAPLQKKAVEQMPQASERLEDFFVYGRLSLSDEDVLDLRSAGPSAGSTALPAQDPCPRVLVGAGETERIVVPGSNGSGATSSTAFHVIWEAVEPISGIGATRTYALTSTLRAEGPTGAEQKVLHAAYVAAAQTCRHLLTAGPLGRVAFSKDCRAALTAAATAFLAAEFPKVSGKLEVACTAVDAMGLPASGLSQEMLVGRGVLLIFLRVALTGILSAEGQALGAVACGDSVFCTRHGPATLDGVGDACRGAEVSALLTGGVPVFACWPADCEHNRSSAIRAGLDSVLGVGAKPQAFVAIGHRPGMRVPLEEAPQLEDPLGLGELLESDFKATLVLDIATATGDAAHPPIVVAKLSGQAWAFKSGKVIFSSARSGCVLLQAVIKDGHGVPALAVSGAAPFGSGSGNIWIAVEALGQAEGSTAPRASLTIDPLTAMQWRDLVDDPDGFRLLTDDVDLQWLNTSGAGLAEYQSSTSSAASMDLKRWLPLAALAGSCTERVVDTSSTPTAPCELKDTRCRCVWVSGLPGSGASDVAVHLAKQVGGAFVDAAAILGFQQQAANSAAAKLCSVLVEAARSAPKQQPLAAATPQAKGKGRGTTGYNTVGGYRERIGPPVAAPQFQVTVVVLDQQHVPAEVVRELIALVDFKETFSEVPRVVSVLEPLVAYPYTSARHPLVLSRAHHGWVDVVAVQDASHFDNKGHIMASRERNVVSERLQKELRSGRHFGQVLLKPSSGALADAISAPEEPAALNKAALRALSFPEGVRVCCPSYELVPAVVELTAPCDVEALRARCAECLAAAARAAKLSTPGRVLSEDEARWAGLFCVEARYSGVKGSELWSLPPGDMQQAVSSGAAEAAQSLVLVPHGELHAPQNWSHPLDQRRGVVWWAAFRRGGPQGESAAAAFRQAAAQAVQACLLRPPEPTAQKTAADVPAAEVERLAQQAKDGDLPAGFFFDGTNYLDADGQILPEHPSLAGLVAEHVAALNSEVNKRNEALRQVSALPLFAAAAAGSGASLI
eukprot:TRINITY_DN49528_c0_g2_i1.p1 TRINITY_DN49528_c0_g2~~TRINITY_DN49528_c0_g2_i1.p1  ORF type:complete len:1312 (+),score=337.56 TRINITY_DN49528_c0_g2_i1:60-3995(+)